MKPFQEQTYYELLEVPVTATEAEIRVAYERLSAQFGPESVALYGLLAPEEAEALRNQLNDAVDILTDEELREEYDRSIGIEPAADEPDRRTPTQLALGDLLDRADLAPVAWRPEPPVKAEPSPTVETSEPEATEQASAQTPSAFEAPVSATRDEAPAEPSSSESPAAEPASSESAGAESAGAESAGAEAPESVQSGAEATGAATGSQLPVLARPKEGAKAPGANEVKVRPIEIPPDAEFNGELLRQVRRSRGRSLDWLAERTRISMRHLENIEADRYDALPAPVYLRGILMNIARELGLDPLRVARSYMELVNASLAK